MRIAVTGVRGGLGRSVARGAAESGHQVVGLDRSGPAGEAEPYLSAFVAADATAHAQLVGAFDGCDALIHLAAYPGPHAGPPHEVHNNNVVASYNVLSIGADLGIGHVCLASSVNAVGGEFSRQPTYDYFPLDEEHPTHNEDPYSLSKWICEEQADSVARRHSWMTLATLRFHWVVPDRSHAEPLPGSLDQGARSLWGYVTAEAATRACLNAVTTTTYTGHERFFVVAPDTGADLPSSELHRTYYPQVPLRRELTGNQSFYDCGKAERLLGWHHDET